MGLGLIFSREIQVNIRLLVALETEEGLERDSEADALHLRAALRTHLLRKVDSGIEHVCPDLFAVPLRILAVRIRAEVMRLQRIHFRDAGHGSDKTRSDGASGADKITVLIRLPDEFLRNNVHDGIALR